MARFHKAIAQLMRQEDGEQGPTAQRSAAATSVIGELQTRVSSEEIALVSAFAKQFLPNARLVESSLSTADLAGLTLGACRFLCDRLSSPLAIRVYAPTAAEHGWSAEHVVLEVATDDQAGLVNTICGVVERLEVQIEALVSASFSVRRDPTGLAVAIAAGTGHSDECLVHLQLSGVDNPSALESAVRQHLDALGRTRQDSGPLLSELQQLSERLAAGPSADAEVASFLSWLADGRFDLAGVEEVGPDGTATRALGIYSEPTAGLEQPWDGDIADSNVAVFKTRAQDPINIGEYLDEVRVRPTHAAARDPRAYRIAGAINAKARRAPSGGAPLAREVYSEVIASLRTEQGAVDHESAAAVFDGLPIDLVLGAGIADITALVGLVLISSQQPGFRVRAFAARPDAGALSFMTVVAPRQHLARNDTERISRIVRDHGNILAQHFVSDDLAVARLHYTLDLNPETLRPETLEDIAAQARKVLSSWREAPVVDHSSAPTAADVTIPPRDAPPPSSGPDQAVGVELRPDQTSSRRFTLRIPTTREPGAFNQLVSAIDDLGLRILRHNSESASEASETHEIAVELGGEGKLDASNLVDLVEAIRAGTVECDELSSLSWRCALGAAAIDLLRAFVALADLSGDANRGDARGALVRNVAATQAFMRAFETKFDPRIPMVNENQRARDLAGAVGVLRSNTEQCEDAGDRRFFRELDRILERTVRTSYYCGDRHRSGRAIAIKLENPGTPEARYETFVYAPGFEGRLLRGGPAARAELVMLDDLASLRDSCPSELDDQQLRASHVTTDPGVACLAVKGSLRDRERIDRAMHEFVDALLSVTDNVADGELDRDADIVAYDEADSYFSFLAGERPTGFADLARKVIQQRAFWMGDAAVTRFDSRVASEGAWAGLQDLVTHRAADENPITAVAVGPPHAIRLPPGVRLVAAFDDHEVFLDPMSDAKKSAEALAKLNRQETSSWSDFPVDLRERGSTVVARSARKLELSKEARELLGWDGDSADTMRLEEAILAYRADILWICGRSAQAVVDSEHGERSTERLTIEPSAVGARVVAEIGGPFFSPAARVAFSMAGGITHTPALDGIAADLLADRVSNVDLALDLAGPGREGVEAYSAEVAASIRRTALEIPARERLSIELDQERSTTDWPAASTCIRRLREGAGAAALERCAISEADLARSRGTELGLTRPEVAIVRSAVGLQLQREIRDSSLGEDPYIRPWLDDYFPAPIADHSPELIDRHPLRYEIAALAISDRVLEVMGFAFVDDTAESLGKSPIDVVKAWCAAMICGGAQEVWSEVESSGIVAGSRDHRHHRRAIERALKKATRRIVELRSADLGLEKIMDRLAAGVGEILRAWPETLPEALQPAHEDAIDMGARTGLDRVAADHLARIAHLADIIDICDLAIQINSPRSTVASVFLGLDALLRFDEIDAMVNAIRHQDPRWGVRAAVHLEARLCAVRRGLTTEVVSHAAGRRQPIERYTDAHGQQIEAVQRTIGEVKSGIHASIAAVEVLIGSLENLTRGQRRSW